MIWGHPASGLQFLSSGLHLSIYYILEVIYIMHYNIYNIYKYMIGGHPASGLQFPSSGLHVSINYILEVIYIMHYNI